MCGISDSLRDLNAYLATRVAVLIKTQFRLDPERAGETICYVNKDSGRGPLS